MGGIQWMVSNCAWRSVLQYCKRKMNKRGRMGTDFMVENRNV
jgi:hypothetical protein